MTRVDYNETDNSGMHRVDESSVLSPFFNKRWLNSVN